MLQALHAFWFIQVIGAIALVFQLVAWNARTRRGILLLQCVNLATFAIHYALLGALTGSLMSIVAFLRNLFLMQKNEHWARHWFWFYFYILVSLGVLYISWQGLISILPAIAVVISMYALWNDSPARMRFFMLIACLTWLPYTIVVHSYSGIASQLVGIVGISLGIYRLDRKSSVAH